jgi:uncharacterized protein YwqG
LRLIDDICDNICDDILDNIFDDICDNIFDDVFDDIFDDIFDDVCDDIFDDICDNICDDAIIFRAGAAGASPAPTSHNNRIIYVETQNIASLQIDALNDHSIVQCRDAIYCVSTPAFSTTPQQLTQQHYNIRQDVACNVLA